MGNNDNLAQFRIGNQISYLNDLTARRSSAASTRDSVMSIRAGFAQAGGYGSTSTYGGGSVYAGGYGNQSTSGQPMLDRFGTNNRAGYYGNLTGVPAQIAQWLGVAQLGASVFGVLDAAMTGTGFNPNDAYATNRGMNGGARAYGGYSDSFQGAPSLGNLMQQRMTGGMPQQFASAQAGGFTGASQSNFLNKPLGIDLSFTAEGAELDAAIADFNKYNGEGAVDIVPSPQGDILVFRDNNARRAFSNDKGVIEIFNRIRQNGGVGRTAAGSTSGNKSSLDSKALNEELDKFSDDLSGSNGRRIEVLKRDLPSAIRRGASEPTLKELLSVSSKLNPNQKEQLVALLVKHGVPDSVISGGLTGETEKAVKGYIEKAKTPQSSNAPTPTTTNPAKTSVEYKYANDEDNHNAILKALELKARGASQDDINKALAEIYDGYLTDEGCELYESLKK